jgi:hypothetical protein
VRQTPGQDLDITKRKGVIEMAEQFPTSLGENIEARIENSTLIIRIDLKKRLRKSSSGKSTIIATTGGNIAIPGTDGAVLGLNLYTKE